MAYTVNYTNPGKTPITIEDAAANNSTSLTLIGKQYDQYGEVIAENFVKLLENFSYTSAPSNPTPGQIWHDSSNKTLKVFDSSGLWKPLSFVYSGTTSPTTSAAQSNGDLWANTITGEIFIYNGSEWIELASQTQVSGISVKTRLDNIAPPNTHYTIEAVSNSKTVFIISTEEMWIPADSEKLVDNSLMKLSFPIVYNGINFNATEPYGLHNLSTTTIDVGRSSNGHVILENNSYDAADGLVGAGITLRTTENPINGSIFSVRSEGNISRLWIGNSATSTGRNDFAVGFTGNIGNEYNLSLYNIKLEFDGNITAKTISGDWVATNAQAIAASSANKIVTPASARAAIDARFVERISTDTLSRATMAEAISDPIDINTMVNDKLMTPLRTRQAINQFVPAVVNDRIDALFDVSSLNPNGYQILPSGLKMQWGKANVAGQSSITVTYPIAFTTTVFSLNSTPINTSAGGGSNDFWGVFNVTNTNFQQHSRYDGAMPFYWFAIGI